MPSFPGIAYAFQRPTDVSGPTALILSRHFQISGGGLTLLEVFFSDLAKDRVLVLTNVTIQANPGATQAVNQLKVQGLAQGQENFGIDQREPLRTADQNETLNWQGEVYLQGGGPGTDTVRMFAAFNGAANANAITVGLHGIIIPRGNLGGF